MSLQFDNPLEKSIQVGQIGRTGIYYTPGVDKDRRVKKLEFDRNIVPVPYIDQKHNQRTACFISGISGSGKSTLAVNLIKKIRKVRSDRKRPIAVFQNGIIEDPTFDGLLDIEFIDINDERFREIGIADLEERIVVFDDFEGIEDKELLKYTYNFLKNVLEKTRKLEVDCIIINHMLMNYTKTKNIIFECTEYYLNIAANRNACIKFLKSYTELSKQQTTELAEHEFENSFDFVVFHKSHPQYLIVENMIQLI